MNECSVDRRHDRSAVPDHPCLELVANSEDKLTLLISRRLITMVKTKEYEKERGEEYRAVTRKSLEEKGISYNDLMKTVCSVGDDDS